MTDYDAIVVGGGVAGASCAYHLTANGVDDVAVFEKDQPASKASGRAAGFITPAQFLSTGIHPEEHRYIIDFWEEMADGSNITLRYDDAYTFAREQESMAYLEQLHEKTAVESRLFTGDEIATRIPDLRTDDIELGFMFEDGFSLDPYTATVTVLNEATAQGAEVRTEPVESISPISQESTQVTTPEGSYTAPTVIIAAGAWSRKLANDIGVPLPLKPRISQLVTLAPDTDVHLPLINDPDLLLYYRTEATGEILIGGGTGKEELDPETFHPTARETFLQEIAEKAPTLSNELEQSDVTGQWAGLCSATPDRHPLVGQIHRNGIYTCCGFNGEGIMYSTVAGHLIADFVTDSTPRFNAQAFAPDRFPSPDADFEIQSAIEW